MTMHVFMLHTGAEARLYISAVHGVLSTHISAAACIIEKHVHACKHRLFAEHALYAEHAGT